jgi:hypothetical protein
LLRSTPEAREEMAELREWTVTAELLAQLIEEVSLVATEGYGRKKPREVPRPAGLRRHRDGTKVALTVLKSTARVRQRPGAA